MRVAVNPPQQCGHSSGEGGRRSVRRSRVAVVGVACRPCRRRARRPGRRGCAVGAPFENGPGCACRRGSLPPARASSARRPAAADSDRAPAAPAPAEASRSRRNCSRSRSSRALSSPSRSDSWRTIRSAAVAPVHAAGLRSSERVCAPARDSCATLAKKYKPKKLDRPRQPPNYQLRRGMSAPPVFQVSRSPSLRILGPLTKPNYLSRLLQTT